MEAFASEEMLRNALGDSYEEEVHPPCIEGNFDHPLWIKIIKEIQEVYDPEIPVNIYELGLIYSIKIDENNNVQAKMTLTAPNCPVAGEMPGMLENAIRKVDDIKAIHVELTFDPPWTPGMMAETAKLQLNMF